MRSSSAVELNLASSPLTASSEQDLEVEYDRDTWRMFNRINSVRADRATEQAASEALGFAGIITSHNEQGEASSSRVLDESSLRYPMQQSTLDQEDDDDSEAIFELDLE